MGVIDRVLEEYQRQETLDHDDLVWLAILTEKMGHVAKATLYAMAETRQSNLAKELTLLTVVTIGWLECIENRHLNSKDNQ